VAIVTGAGRGLGREVAVLLSAEGAAVAVAARSARELAATAETIEGAGGRALPVACDVSDPRAVAEMVSDVEGQLGPVDLLVADAGVVSPLGPVWETDPDEWWRTVEMNLRGVFLCAHAVLPAMTGRGRGRIVNVVSQAGIHAVPFGSAYSTSKATVIGLTEAIALEAGPGGVSIFAMEPGWMRTAMTDYLVNSDAGQRWTPRAAEYGMQAHVPIQRSAQLVVELASGRADGLSGRYLTVLDDLDDLVRDAERIRHEGPPRHAAPDVIRRASALTCGCRRASARVPSGDRPPDCCCCQRRPGSARTVRQYDALRSLGRACASTAAAASVASRINAQSAATSRSRQASEQ
jgi:NAD(P)-dependent dehydrogenase (short-subunit alcohol dehydrogenase family)